MTTAGRAVVALTLAYALAGLAVFERDAVYSGDIGVKLVQARALAANRFRSLDINYPGEFLDPSREFFPIRPPFVMHVGGETQAIFSPAFAIAQAAAVALFGLAGLTLLSVAGGALILASVERLAPAAVKLPAVLAAGVAGPLWFFASTGWEHASAVACGTAAFALALGPAAPTRSLAAGLLLGAGVLIRDEVLLLAPGLVLMLWMAERRVKPPAIALAGLAAALLAGSLIEGAWFGRPVASHLRHAVSAVAGPVVPASFFDPEVPVLAPMTFRQRYETVVQYWLLGYGADRMIAGYAAGLAVAFLIYWRTRSHAGLLLWLVAIAALAAADLVEVVTAPKWLAGLLRVAPYLVCALLPPIARTERASVVPAVACWTTAVYLVTALLVVDTTGGKSLGPRLLLPLFPMLALAAVIRIHEYAGARDRFARWSGWVGAGLCVMAAGIHVFGTFPAYVDRNRDDASSIAEVRRLTERVVVADDEFTVQLLFPLYDRKIIMLADTPQAGEALGALLDRQRVNDVLLVTRWSDTPVQLPPFRRLRTQLWGRMTIQQWQRQGR